jgi:hypothetical protein
MLFIEIPNYFNIKHEPTVLKKLIEGDKNVSNIKTKKPEITTHDNIKSNKPNQPKKK